MRARRFFRSMGNSKISMYASLMMNIVNVGGNAFADFWVSDGSGRRRIGFPGIQNAGGGIRTFYLLRNQKNLIYIEHWMHWKPNFDMMKNILLHWNSHRVGKWHVPDRQDPGGQPDCHFWYGKHYGECSGQ